EENLSKDWFFRDQKRKIGKPCQEGPVLHVPQTKHAPHQRMPHGASHGGIHQVGKIVLQDRQPQKNKSWSRKADDNKKKARKEINAFVQKQVERGLAKASLPKK
ncbi:MAG: hypothetical protein ACRCZI_13730, partial [Cetobacterium sp.]